MYFDAFINNQAPQTAAIRTYLRGKYAAVKLFQAREALAPKDPLDIGVNAGDLVGVVQQKDPLGNRDRWFVDNGQAQGFVQSREAIEFNSLQIIWAIFGPFFILAV